MFALEMECVTLFVTTKRDSIGEGLSIQGGVLMDAKIALIEQYRQHAKDTGSPEVQIALLS
jgi:hypothetical protein